MRLPGFIKEIQGLNRNIKVYLVTIFLSNLSFGVFQADFNLYILSLGLTPDFLGIILSLAPFAQAITAIPIGFLAEKIGHKRSLILVNLVVGLAYLMRVISTNRWIILAGSFLAGVMACGYFIIQLPFLSHYAGENKNLPFTFANLIMFSATSFGALLGGFLPRWIAPLALGTVPSFRLVLAAFSLLIIVGTLPLFLLSRDKPSDTTHISLSPYLKGIDGSTIKFAVVELFIGFGLAFLIFFMNLFFVFHYGSDIESFGIMNLILIIPLTIILLVGPALALRFKNLRVVLAARLVSVFLAAAVGLTTSAVIGGGAYILFRSFTSLSQTLWFAFAASIATRRSRMATSAWLEITFQIGLGIAALVGGRLIASGAYFTIGMLSALSMAVSFVLTYIFFGRRAKLSKSANPAQN